MKIYISSKYGDALKFINPEDYNQPAHMDQYYAGTDDNGGVHTNSVIPNKADYLTIKAVGKTKLKKFIISFNELSSNSNFVDTKIASTTKPNRTMEDSSEVSCRQSME